MLKSHGSRTRVKGRAVNEEKKLKKASTVLLSPTGSMARAGGRRSWCHT